jgi:DNA ligase-1
LTSLLEVAQASAEIATTGARSAKTKRLAAVLRAAAVEEVPAIVAWLSGDLLQRRIGVGWASLATWARWIAPSERWATRRARARRRGARRSSKA